MQTLLCTWLLLFSFLSHAFDDSQKLNLLSDSEKVQAMWVSHLDGSLDPVLFYQTSFVPSKLSKIDLMRLSKIRLSFEKSLKSAHKRKIDLQGKLSRKDVLKLAAEYELLESQIGLISKENQEALSLAQKELKSLFKFRQKTPQEITDLFYSTPDNSSYKAGEYKDSLKLFLFCRHNRNYPCLFVMKDIFNSPVRKDNNELWSLQVLAKSRKGLTFNYANGNTPSGVQSIDSVMPHASRPKFFGKFRRLILNWISSTKEVKKLLPKSAHDKKWWKEASIAKDIGRRWLRIHGTGNRNDNKLSPYYTHFPTSGCISTREGEYDGVNYLDQRVLLDKMMSSMQLRPIYQNEVKLKAILYVIELDDKKEKVTPQTLQEFGLQ